MTNFLASFEGAWLIVKQVVPGTPFATAPDWKTGHATVDTVYPIVSDKSEKLTFPWNTMPATRTTGSTPFVATVIAHNSCILRSVFELFVLRFICSLKMLRFFRRSALITEPPSYA
jgi:hypothetical protein